MLLSNLYGFDIKINTLIDWVYSFKTNHRTRDVSRVMNNTPIKVSIL